MDEDPNVAGGCTSTFQRIQMWLLKTVWAKSLRCRIPARPSADDHRAASGKTILHPASRLGVEEILANECVAKSESPSPYILEDKNANLVQNEIDGFCCLSQAC